MKICYSSNKIKMIPSIWIEQTNLLVVLTSTSFQRPLSQPLISTPSSSSPLGSFPLGSLGFQFVYDISRPSTATKLPSCSISLMPIQICSLGRRPVTKSFSAWWISRDHKWRQSPLWLPNHHDGVTGSFPVYHCGAIQAPLAPNPESNIWQNWLLYWHFVSLT